MDRGDDAKGVSVGKGQVGMTEKIIFAGSGGQGIILMAKVLAQAVVQKGKNITCLPAYGAQVRGGTSYCMLIVSDNQIASPYINCADSLIAMNEPSLKRYLPRLKKQRGLLILNRSLINIKVTRNNLEIVDIACSDIATKLGNIKVANMVALGAYLAKKKILPLKDLLNTIHSMAVSAQKTNLFLINKQALSEGFSYGKGSLRT